MNVLTEYEGLGDAGNLYRSIDKMNVHGLNLVAPESAQGIIKPWEHREDITIYAESNPDDPEMIIHIPFIENVRVKTVLLKLGRGDRAPRQLRIFVNHTNIVDFDEAQVIEPTMDFALRVGEEAIVEYPVRGAIFSNIHSLSLLFKSYSDEGSIQVFCVGFRGDVRFPRRSAEQKLEIPAENAASADLTDKIAEKSGGQQTTAR